MDKIAEVLNPNYRVDWRFMPRAGVKASCCRQGVTEDVALSLVDLTDIGVGLVVRGTVAKGERVVVTLQAPTWSAAIERQGQVVWAESAGETSRLGIAFVAGLGFTEFEDLCELPGPETAS